MAADTGTEAPTPSPPCVGKDPRIQRKPRRRRRRMLTGVSRQRRAANARERRRIHGVNEAFLELKATLPVVKPDDVSKTETLRLAAKWIAHLTTMLIEDDRKRKWSPSTSSRCLPAAIQARLSELLNFDLEDFVLVSNSNEGIGPSLPPQVYGPSDHCTLPAASANLYGRQWGGSGGGGGGDGDVVSDMRALLDDCRDSEDTAEESSSADGYDSFASDPEPVSDRRPTSGGGGGGGSCSGGGGGGGGGGGRVGCPEDLACSPTVNDLLLDISHLHAPNLEELADHYITGGTPGGTPGATVGGYHGFSGDLCSTGMHCSRFNTLPPVSSFYR